MYLIPLKLVLNCTSIKMYFNCPSTENFHSSKVEKFYKKRKYFHCLLLIMLFVIINITDG